jgi:histone-lysine N-methyltransferase SETD3
MLAYNHERRAVELLVDRHYAAGEPVHAWCGPQPNSRLLINYGIVDEHNPYDRLSLTVSLASSDPLYPKKRALLQQLGMTPSQVGGAGTGQAAGTSMCSCMCGLVW